MQPIVACNESQTCVLTPWDYAEINKSGWGCKLRSSISAQAFPPLIDDRIDTTFVKIDNRFVDKSGRDKSGSEKEGDRDLSLLVGWDFHVNHLILWIMNVQRFVNYWLIIAVQRTVGIDHRYTLSVRVYLVLCRVHWQNEAGDDNRCL